MEKDTVLLDVETYNELRDFKKEIEDGNTYRLEFGMWHNSLRFISTDEALKEMHQILEKMNQTLETKNKILEELKNSSKKESSTEEIKTMSLWKFIKWKSGKL